MFESILYVIEVLVLHGYEDFIGVAPEITLCVV